MVEHLPKHAQNPGFDPLVPRKDAFHMLKFKVLAALSCSRSGVEIADSVVRAAQLL